MSFFTLTYIKNPANSTHFLNKMYRNMQTMRHFQPIWSLIVVVDNMWLVVVNKYPSDTPQGYWCSVSVVFVVVVNVFVVVAVVYVVVVVNVVVAGLIVALLLFILCLDVVNRCSPGGYC